MKAFVRINAESQEVKLAEVPEPQINSNEVLLKVKAFGVGIHDRYFIPSDANFPYPIGSEGAGIITKVGSNVQKYAVDDRVIFTTVLQAQGGAWAEYAVSNQSALIPLPKELSFVQGATIPVAGKTALECMRELELKNGDCLFVAGASGAIGTLVIQLAAAKGVHVAASASAENQNYMKSIGAEKTVDYNNENWKDELKEWAKEGVDAALAIQLGTGKDCLELVKDGGKLITVSGDNNQLTTERNIEIRQMGHSIDTQKELVRLVKDMAKGGIQIVVEKEYPFEEALEALEKTETRHARGKLIVKVGQ